MKKLLLLIILLTALSGFSSELLSLDDLIDAAFSDNPQIHSKEYELKASQTARFSVYSSILPKADLGMRYTYLGEVPYLAFPDELSSMMPEMGKIEMGKHDNYDLTLSLQQPIFTGLSLYRGIKLSNIDVELKDIEYDRAKSNIALDVKKGYYNLIRSISSLATAQKAFDGLTAHYKDIKNLYDNGLLVKNDLLQVEVALSEMELNLIRIEHAIDLTRQNLSTLTGIDAEKINIDTLLSYNKSRFSPQEAESLAILHNFDMMRMDAGQRAARQNVGLNIAKLMPTLAVAGNYHYKNPTQDLEEAWEDSWDVSIVANLNVFSWGHDIAKIQEARYKKKAYEKTMENAENMISQGVNAIMIGLQEAEFSIEISEAEIVQAEENLRITLDRFKVGDATNTEVLDAEASLYRARNNRINAICDHNIKKAELYSIIGYIR
ncbi:MAG: TolC family protein [Candidatus Zixiibacteriota bacterium]